jgi:hypothetical protein
MSLVAYLAQLERLIHATKFGCAKPFREDVLRALYKMRQTEIGYSIIHIVIVVLYIVLASHAIKAEWFIVLIIMTIETLSTTLTFFWFVAQKHLRKRAGGQRIRAANSSVFVNGGESTNFQGTGTMTIGGDVSSYQEADTPRSGRFAPVDSPK